MTSTIIMLVLFVVIGFVGYKFVNYVIDKLKK